MLAEIQGRLDETVADRDHGTSDYGNPPACENPEADPEWLLFGSGCAPCVLALHARAMEAPDRMMRWQWVDGGPKHEGTAAAWTNELILFAGLPLPLVPT